MYILLVQIYSLALKLKSKACYSNLLHNLMRLYLMKHINQINESYACAKMLNEVIIPYNFIILKCKPSNVLYKKRSLVF